MARHFLIQVQWCNEIVDQGFGEIKKMKTISFIRVGWLFDGSGKPMQENVLIRLADGKILSIEPYSKELGIDGDALSDLAHCIVLPPLVDCHVHLFMSATTDKVVRDRQLVADYQELRPAISQHLKYLFSHGVLAVRDGGDRGGYALRFRDEEEIPPEMTLKVSGRAFHNKGRYGSLIGRDPGGERLTSALEIDDEEKEFVKIVNSGLNSLQIYGKETSPQFSLEELREVVKIAETRNQKVMVHANGREPVKIAVEAGCHSIEHGFFMGRDNLQRMADNGTRWVPTIFTMKAYGLNLGSKDGANQHVLKKNVEHQLEQLRLARELGVEVVVGTDAGSLGVLHGESMAEEMKLFKKAGYTLPEVISSATVKGAELVGAQRIDTLTPGNRANFLVARGAPGQLPRKLNYLENIYTNGTPSAYYQKNPIKHVVRS